MELGFHLPIFDIDGGTTAIAGELARVGTAAEEAGATWLSFMDHYFQIEPTGLPAESNMLEGYTTLGFLAAHTSRIELGLLVTGVTYRHPGLLAKIVTTLDVLSGGRACWASARPGSSASTGGWACRSRRSPSGSSAWRRRCASAGRCGTRRTTVRSRASTTSSPRRCGRSSLAELHDAGVTGLRINTLTGGGVGFVGTRPPRSDLRGTRLAPAVVRRPGRTGPRETGQAPRPVRARPPGACPCSHPTWWWWGSGSSRAPGAGALRRQPAGRSALRRDWRESVKAAVGGC